MISRISILGLSLMAAWVGCALLHASEIAERIDAILSREYEQRGIEPSPLCSDEVFLRRATIDLAGRIPTLNEIEQFRRDPNRAEKIQELVKSNQFASTFADSWTSVFLGPTREYGIDREAFRVWIYQCLRENMPYNEIAKLMIAGRGQASLDGNVNFLVRYQDEPAVRVSRLFLGVRLDCARCHDHPFDRWTQEHFEQISKFYRGLRVRDLLGEDREVFDDLAETRRVHPSELPVFFTGAKPRTAIWRDEFAYFTTRSRPFARVFVNRLWHQLVGRGIVDPPDDFHSENQPSSRELLEFLTDAAIDAKFDIRKMVVAICGSKAYQRSSVSHPVSLDAVRLFAVGTRKPLTPEQSIDSYAVALGVPVDRQYRQAFLRQVTESDSSDASGSWQYNETVQALMNRITTPLIVTKGSLDEVFLRALTRLPTEQERTICKGKPLEDIAFALVHSNEFFFRP